MPGSPEFMQTIAKLPRRHHLKGKQRKIFVREFVAVALGLSRYTVTGLFSPHWYAPTEIHRFLIEHGYQQPGRGRPKKRS